MDAAIIDETNAALEAAKEFYEQQPSIIDIIGEMLFDYQAPGSRPVAPNGYPERMGEIAKLCFHNFPGDVVEIGALNGHTTAYLARAAQESNRRVHAIDPWEPNVQQCKPNTYEKFSKRMARFGDTVAVLRARSQDQVAIDYITGLELALAIVDGLHETEACYRDIMTVAHAHVIVVDDIRWNPNVRKAFDRAAEELERDVIVRCGDGIREGYILKGE